MTLANCPACREKLSVSAQACPKCGHPLPEGWGETAVKKQRAKARRNLIIISSVVVGFVVIGAIRNLYDSVTSAPDPRGSLISDKGIQALEKNQEFERGLEAARSGEYAEAHDVWLAIGDIAPLGYKGHREAQFNLGTLYESGRGVRKNMSTAAGWYRRAAEQGHAGAQYNLGMMYLEGRGVDKNPTIAVRLLKKAGKQNHASAQYNLGMIYQSQEVLYAACLWFRKAAANGIPAPTAVCERDDYEQGYAAWFGEDYASALAKLRPLAQQGHAKAQNVIAHMYEKGTGVPQSYTKALEWYPAWLKRQSADVQNEALGVTRAKLFRQWEARITRLIRLADDAENASADQSAPNLSVADELKKLADLLQQGILTEDEFSQQKKRLLDRTDKIPPTSAAT